TAGSRPSSTHAARRGTARESPRRTSRARWPTGAGTAVGGPGTGGRATPRRRARPAPPRGGRPTWNSRIARVWTATLDCRGRTFPQAPVLHRGVLLEAARRDVRPGGRRRVRGRGG